MAEWKPGDVAMVTLTDGKKSAAIRSDDGRRWVIEPTSLPMRKVADARPLVVIDPEDREQIERLLRGYAGWTSTDDGIENYPRYVDDMQAALREFANPTPVIEEPTNLYAVVRDTGGHEWCHVGGQVWRSLTSTGQFKVEKHWYDTGAPLAGNVTRVLSFGYTEDGA